MKMSLKEYMSITQKKSGNKYGAKKTMYNDRLFDSKREATRAYELDILKRAGDVVKIEYQVPFVCMINNKKICTYLADFRVTYEDGHVEVEDSKGYRTDVYKLKKKLVEALFDIKIIET